LRIDATTRQRLLPFITRPIRSRIVCAAEPPRAASSASMIEKRGRATDPAFEDLVEIMFESEFNPERILARGCEPIDGKHNKVPAEGFETLGEMNKGSGLPCTRFPDKQKRFTGRDAFDLSRHGAIDTHHLILYTNPRELGQSFFVSRSRAPQFSDVRLEAARNIEFETCGEQSAL